MSRPTDIKKAKFVIFWPRKGQTWQPWTRHACFLNVGHIFKPNTELQTSALGEDCDGKFFKRTQQA